MKHATYGPEQFLQDVPVSRETLDRLQTYVELLRSWNRTTNLVGASTLPDVWRRHILDSAQLWPFVAGAGGLADLGSGAGLPGVVIAILGIVPNLHLVESDQRKAAFLREALRITEARATVHAVRIEALAPLAASHITARALAPVAKLLELVEPLTTEQTVFVLPKGQNVEDELTEAHKMWRMRVETHSSRTDPHARIVILREVHRA